MYLPEILFWGVFGLTAEIVFTSILDLFTKNKIALIGYTSLWMFPIYAFGLSYGFDLVVNIIHNDIIRYLSYPIWVWLVELLIGYLFLILNIRLWDYNYLPQGKHWKGIISFVHFPVWIILGISVEYIKQILF